MSRLPTVREERTPVTANPVLAETVSQSQAANAIVQFGQSLIQLDDTLQKSQDQIDIDNLQSKYLIDLEKEQIKLDKDTDFTTYVGRAQEAMKQIRRNQDKVLSTSSDNVNKIMRNWYIKQETNFTTKSMAQSRRLQILSQQADHVANVKDWTTHGINANTRDDHKIYKERIINRTSLLVQNGVFDANKAQAIVSSAIHSTEYGYLKNLAAENPTAYALIADNILADKFPTVTEPEFDSIRASLENVERQRQRAAAKALKHQQEAAATAVMINISSSTLDPNFKEYTRAQFIEDMNGPAPRFTDKDARAINQLLTGFAEGGGIGNETLYHTIEADIILNRGKVATSKITKNAGLQSDGKGGHFRGLSRAQVNNLLELRDNKLLTFEQRDHFTNQPEYKKYENFLTLIVSGNERNNAARASFMIPDNKKAQFAGALRTYEEMQDPNGKFARLHLTPFQAFGEAVSRHSIVLDRRLLPKNGVDPNTGQRFESAAQIKKAYEASYIDINKAKTEILILQQRKELISIMENIKQLGADKQVGRIGIEEAEQAELDAVFEGQPEEEF